MKVLFANIPFVEQKYGRRWTGVNSGGRFPCTEPGNTRYAPYPFLLAWAVSYLRLRGIEADLYDGVAMNHWETSQVYDAIRNSKPDVLFLDLACSTRDIVLPVASWAKRELKCKIALCGPYCGPYIDRLLDGPDIDYVITGDYEIPAFRIATEENPPRRFQHEQLAQINTVNGINFVPYRVPEDLSRYLDPAMDMPNAPRIQLQVCASRGCPFGCGYCQLPITVHNGRYRARNPDNVIEEICELYTD